MQSIDPVTEQAARLFLERIAAQYDLAGALLFGSRARQTHRPDSDADLAVLLRGEQQRFLPIKLAMADVAFDVLLETGINISPLPVWLEEWEHPDRYPNPRLLKAIASAISRDLFCNSLLKRFKILAVEVGTDPADEFFFAHEAARFHNGGRCQDSCRLFSLNL